MDVANIWVYYWIFSDGCSLPKYLEEKGLTAHFLNSCGVLHILESM